MSKIMKTFRIDENVVKALDELSKGTGYSQTDLIEFAVCNLYSMYFVTASRVLDYKDEDFLMKLEFQRLQFKKSN